MDDLTKWGQESTGNETQHREAGSVNVAELVRFNSTDDKTSEVWTVYQRRMEVAGGSVGSVSSWFP